MQQQLKSQVKNAGESGANTSRAVALANARLRLNQSSPRPTLTTLLIGSNDACNSTCLRTPEQTRENLRKIISIAQGVGSVVLLITPPPFDEKTFLTWGDAPPFKERTPTERFADVCAVIREVADEYCLPLLELADVAVPLAADGLHPSAEGYALIAQKVYEAVKGFNTKQVLCLGDSITYGFGADSPGRASRGESFPAVLQTLLNK